MTPAEDSQKRRVFIVEDYPMLHEELPNLLIKQPICLPERTRAKICRARAYNFREVVIVRYVTGTCQSAYSG